MKLIFNSILGASLVIAVSTQSSVSFAAEGGQNCSCVVAANGTAIGKVTSLSGDVLQSSKAGYILATEGSSVVNGSLLSVGSRSAAKVSFGSDCSILVPANSELKISSAPNATAQICASVTSTGQKNALSTTFDSRETQYGADLPNAVLNESIAEPVAESVDRFPVGYLLLGAAVAGGVGYGIFELIDDDDDAPGDNPATAATVFEEEPYGGGELEQPFDLEAALEAA